MAAWSGHVGAPVRDGGRGGRIGKPAGCGYRCTLNLSAAGTGAGGASRQDFLGVEQQLRGTVAVGNGLLV
jgi:hypothetical protein